MRGTRLVVVELEAVKGNRGTRGMGKRQWEGMSIKGE